MLSSQKFNVTNHGFALQIRVGDLFSEVGDDVLAQKSKTKRAGRASSTTWDPGTRLRVPVGSQG